MAVRKINLIGWFRKINFEQLKRFHLEHLTNPDPRIIKKFSNPNNRYVKPFVKEFGSAFQIELEVLDPLPQFKRIISGEVEKLFDGKKREEVLNRPEHSQEPEVIKEQIIDANHEPTGLIRLPQLANFADYFGSISFN